MKHPLFWTLVFGVLALAASFQGLGLPNHPYQAALAGMVLFIGYRLGWLRIGRSRSAYALWVLDACLLAMQAKLLIGGGVRMPFAWVRLPALQSAPPTGSWFDFLPRLMVQWQALSLNEWQVDLTQIQTFLVILTAVGAWFRFQPFASLTALALLVVSLPAYIDFQWNWVLPSMAATTVCFLLQTPTPRRASER